MPSEHCIESVIKNRKIEGFQGGRLRTFRAFITSAKSRKLDHRKENHLIAKQVYSDASMPCAMAAGLISSTGVKTGSEFENFEDEIWHDRVPKIHLEMDGDPKQNSGEHPTCDAGLAKHLTDFPDQQAQDMH